MGLVKGQGFLTTGDVARLLGVSSQRVQQLADAGRLPHERGWRGMRMFDQASVDAFIADRETAA